MDKNARPRIRGCVSPVTRSGETMKALITRKVGMTSTIAEDGVVQAVTLLSASPCVITQVKTDDTDGYTAIQVGFETAKEAKTPKAQAGHFKASGINGPAD